MREQGDVNKRVEVLGTNLACSVEQSDQCP
jgi:hypothetical protein